MRRELSWLGYGALSSGMLGHPSGDRQSLDETLLELKLTDKVVVLIANTGDVASREVLRKLSHDCWDLDGIEKKVQPLHSAFQLGGSRSQESKEKERRAMFPGADPAHP